MEQQEMLELLERVKAGETSPRDALLQMKMQPFEDLGYAKVDHHRGLRQGAQEVIYGAGKTPEQIAGILRAMAGRGAKNIIVTRMSAEAAEKVKGEGVPLDYDPLSRFGLANPAPIEDPKGLIAVVSGGTSDMAVCEEAARTAEAMGNRVERVYDVAWPGCTGCWRGWTC